MDERLIQILEHYGRKAQKLKLVEECAELIQAVLKGDAKHLAEEMADVEIMIAQIKYSIQLEKFVDEIKEYKIQRTLERIKNER